MGKLLDYASHELYYQLMHRQFGNTSFAISSGYGDTAIHKGPGYSGSAAFIPSPSTGIVLGPSLDRSPLLTA